MNQVSFMPEKIALPIDWDVAFPPDERTRFTIFQTESNQSMGVVVRRYTSREARFVLRGELKSEKDLVVCLAAAEKTARQLGCSVLTTQEKVNPNWLAALNTFQSQGFKSIDESWVFNGPFQSFADRIQRIALMLEHKKAIPEEARVSSLTEGHERVRSLLNATLMMDDFEFDNRLRTDASKPISAAYSQIAWFGKKVVGVLLVAPTANKGVYDIPIRYVLPDYRQTWVNALLIAECVKHGESIGAEFIQFEANSKSHYETLYLARKTGCRRVAVFNRFEKQLNEQNL